MITFLKSKILSFFAKELVEEYKAGFNNGMAISEKEGTRLDTEQIERKALNMFCEQNHVVNPNHVFDLTKAGVYLGMELTTRETAKELKQQASLLKDFLLWDILQETIRNEAIHIGLKTSMNWDGVLQGKSMLLNLDIIRGIVDKMAKIDVDKLLDSKDTKIVI